MRLSALAVTFLASLDVADGFIIPSPSFLATKRPVRTTAAAAAGNQNSLHEFDFLLREGGDDAATTAITGSVHRRRILVPSAEQERAIQFTSSSSALLSEEEEMALQDEEELRQLEETSDDPYDDIFSEQLNKLKEYDESLQKKPAVDMNQWLKNSDFSDLVVTLALPSFLAFIAIRWGSSRVYTYLETRATETLDDFANEMVYYDGDFEEMRFCQKDYARRLVWLGPKRTDAMLKRYLQTYAKKKTVSPQSISSLSYAFSLFNLSEEKAATTLVSLCREMGTDKISSAAKLLFFGTHILKSPEGKAALVPIKDLIKSTYRDEEVAETLVETSQQAIGEAAYRAAVQKAGKNQQTLTVGWEVLGLDEDTALRIFEEEADEGFMTYRETMYGGQTRLYDSKGNVVDKDGKILDPEAAAAQEAEDAEEATSGNVFECASCGYTLFVAKGRDFKFYGEDFKCPECGAPKDQFESRIIEED